MRTPPKGPHDLGGESAATIDRSEKEITFWEQRIDAMVNLLRSKGVIADWAELRNGVETLTREDYHRLDYYERWATSAAAIAVNKGLVTQQELDERAQQLKNSCIE